MVEGIVVPVTTETERATIAIIGSFENGTVAIQTFVEDYAPLEAGQSRIEIFHASEGGPALDVVLNGEPVVSSLAYPGTLGDNDGQIGATIPAGLANISFNDNATGALVVFVNNSVFAEQTSYLIVLAGTGADVVVLRFATPIAN